MDAVATENRPKPKRKQYMTRKRRAALAAKEQAGNESGPSSLDEYRAAKTEKRAARNALREADEPTTSISEAVMAAEQLVETAPKVVEVAAAPSPPVVNPNNPKNWMITFYPEGSTRGKGQWVCRQETADVVWVWDNEGRHTALFKRMTPDYKEMPFRELAMEYVDMKNSQKLVMA